MPTISQLPSAASVSASDLIPISQGGSVHSVSVGALLAQTQPAIIVDPPSLLGRFSLGPGGPDTITVGGGLMLNDGTLSANSLDPATLTLQTVLSPADQIVVTSAGVSQLIGLDQLRSLFTAGPNITIDATGIISTSASGGTSTYSLTALSSVPTLASGDLVGVSQGGQDHTISYANLLNGLTVDLAQPAAAASDGDTFWVAQTSNIMVRQTLSALWPWISGKMPLWRRPVIELSANTTLNGTSHNNALLVCSSSVTVSVSAASLGSGFSCELINASSGPVTFSGSILSSTGSTQLAPFQCGTIQCITYSGGTVVYASIGAGSSATMAPGQASGLVASSIASTSITLTWSAPTSGGIVSVYSVQYRVTGTTPWLLAGQTNGAQTFTVNGLLVATSYDFTIGTANSVGAGPISAISTSITLVSGPVPGAPTAVTTTNITATSINCSWVAPTVGGTGLVYAVQYRVTGQSTWNSAAAGLSATTFAIGNLASATSYDIQITASNGSGSGPPSTLLTVQTSQAAGMVTSITWQLAPVGSFTHGAGTIGMNAHVNPATAPIQFGFSTSPTSPPTAWVTALNINTDFWGQYLPTPASAGSWYAWVEGTDGSAPTVYPTPFTVT